MGSVSGSILLLRPFSLCPVFRHIIFDAPLLNVNFRCKNLCFRLFIHSIGTKSLDILLGELSYLLWHFLWVNFEFSVLMSDIVVICWFKSFSFFSCNLCKYICSFIIFVSFLGWAVNYFN